MIPHEYRSRLNGAAGVLCGASLTSIGYVSSTGIKVVLLALAMIFGFLVIASVFDWFPFGPSDGGDFRVSV